MAKLSLLEKFKSLRPVDYLNRFCFYYDKLYIVYPEYFNYFSLNNIEGGEIPDFIINLIDAMISYEYGL